MIVSDAMDARSAVADTVSTKRAVPAFRSGISARALVGMSFPPIKYVVPGYIVEGLTVFAGAPKLGKSWACLGLGLAVASGGLAFGSIPCDQGDVLYLALEDNTRRLQKRLRQLRLGELPERMVLLTEWPTLDGDCIPELEAWLHETPGARLIMIDVFAKVRGAAGRTENQYEVDYRYIAALQALAGRYGVAIVVVHHTRKMEAEDPFDAVSGTRGLTGAADTVLVLKRDAGSQTPVLYGRGRDLAEIETAMEFDRDTGEWRIIGNAVDIAKTAERQEILQVLGRSVDPMTPTEIADRVGKSRSNVSHLLARLYDEGKIEKQTKGRYTSLNPVHSVHPVHSSAASPSLRVNGVNGVKGIHRDPILAPGETGDEPVEGWGNV